MPVRCISAIAILFVICSCDTITAHTTTHYTACTRASYIFSSFHFYAFKMLSSTCVQIYGRKQNAENHSSQKKKKPAVIDVDQKKNTEIVIKLCTAKQKKKLLVAHVTETMLLDVRSTVLIILLSRHRYLAQPLHVPAKHRCSAPGIQQTILCSANMVRLYWRRWQNRSDRKV